MQGLTQAPLVASHTPCHPTLSRGRVRTAPSSVGVPTPARTGALTPPLFHPGAPEPEGRLGSVGPMFSPSSDASGKYGSPWGCSSDLSLPSPPRGRADHPLFSPASLRAPSFLHSTRALKEQMEASEAAKPAGGRAWQGTSRAPGGHRPRLAGGQGPRAREPPSPNAFRHSSLCTSPSFATNTLISCC